MATTYEPATAAEGLANDLIPEFHPHLKQARIVWLKTSTGQSKARATNALMRYLAGKDAEGVTADFVVVVTDADWYARKAVARRALVDTLLCSMTRQSNADTGKDRWAIAKPDVSLYLAVVKRHGLSTTEELQVGKLIKDLPEQLALAMDGDDQDDEEVENPWFEGGVADEEAEHDHSDWPEAPATFGPSADYGGQPMSESDWTGKDETPAVGDDPTREEDWETATRPDVTPETISRIRGSVEASAR